MIEKEENSFCEEPKIYYYSTSENFGVRSFFSDRKKNPNNKYPNSFSPCSLHNNTFSVYNTIMLPNVNGECFLDSDKNYFSDKIKDNNSPQICQMKTSSIQKDITMNKTECSNEEKNITYENQLKELLIGVNNKTLSENPLIQKKNINFEKNPYFLGNVKTKRSQNNVVLKKKTNLEIECENDDDFFKKGPSRSLICSNNNRKHNNVEDDDKSENIPKKNKKLSMKKDYFNLKFENKKEKSIKDKSHRMKPKLSLHIKNIKLGRKEDNINKGDDTKIKKEKYKSNEKRINNFYYSNKCVTNNFIINNFTPKNKKENDNKDSKSSGEKSNNKKNIEKKNLKKSQWLRNHRNDNIARNNKEENIKKNNIKSNKDENNNINKKILTNRFHAYIQEKELNLLKDIPKKKEYNDDGSKEKSFDIGKKKSENNINKNKRYNSKKELKRVIINKDEEEKKKTKFKKQKISRGKSVEKKDIKSIKKSVQLRNNLDEEDNYTKEKTKILSNKQIMQKESDDLDNIKKKKPLTADKCKKKSCSNMKFKNSFNSFRKKIQEVPKILFANDNKIKKQKKIDFEYALKKIIKKTQFNLFSKDKFTNTEFNDCDYLKYTLDCMDLILDIDIEKQFRLKNKINFNFPKSKKNKTKKKIALFDLDETLIHCTGDINTKKEKYQHVIEIKLPGRQAVKVGINIRPYWKQTLNLIKKNYYIVIYTASHQAYADSVLDFMDPKKKYFKYRLYRNNCSLIDVDGAKFYVKDLDIFNEYYDLKDIVIIDNSVLSFAYHLHNGIPIVPYYDEDKDGSLYVVGLYLMNIFNEDDLREANKKQINLDSFLEEAKKKKEEEYLEEDQIEEESVSKEEDLDTNKNIPVIKKSSKKSCIKEMKDFDKEKKYNIKHSSFKFLSKKDDENNDFAQKKLMSCSKLINMYYEVKDKSNNNENNNNEFNNKSDNKKLEESTEKKNIIFEDSDDIECKSQPGYSKELINFYKNEINDNEKETRFLKRLFTIIDDLSLKQKNKDNKFEKNIYNICCSNKKNNLGFIRSKFYNNFKI